MSNFLSLLDRLLWPRTHQLCINSAVKIANAPESSIDLEIYELLLSLRHSRRLQEYDKGKSIVPRKLRGGLKAVESRSCRSINQQKKHLVYGNSGGGGSGLEFPFFFQDGDSRERTWVVARRRLWWVGGGGGMVEKLDSRMIKKCEKMAWGEWSEGSSPHVGGGREGPLPHSMAHTGAAIFIISSPT
ncbi:hypothetical protein LSTR_LSTR011790 [Laodelphax striatellus]|uniref:Uncharacterized protein n=1 Tax=Laodelphax striatellus TaxID=195883 RepID=A0A482WS98_LAOST|nr:hypothetical protein LSTR_LSTR011790 [Laodelphax striatellus]